eukprot:jgi/Ulvmu1/3415/UM016_0033.1
MHSVHPGCCGAQVSDTSASSNRIVRVFCGGSQWGQLRVLVCITINAVAQHAQRGYNASGRNVRCPGMRAARWAQLGTLYPAGMHAKNAWHSRLQSVLVMEQVCSVFSTQTFPL